MGETHSAIAGVGFYNYIAGDDVIMILTPAFPAKNRIASIDYFDGYLMAFAYNFKVHEIRNIYLKFAKAYKPWTVDGKMSF